MSVDIKRMEFICKKCGGILDDDDRRMGQWVAKYPEKVTTMSGYWVSLLICPWVSAEYIVKKFQHSDTTPEFFYTKILGLPYADASSKLLRQSFFQNLTGTQWAPEVTERIVIGIDTGLRIDYVVGNKHGIFHSDDADDYGDLDILMKRWPKAIAIIDQGGDLIGSRKFYERWPGRVYLCALAGDRNTKELVTWGKGDEHGAVRADRNRMIQLVVDEYRNKRIPVHGTEDDWYEYYIDWSRLAKTKIIDPDTNVVKGYKWIRSGRDHKAMATIFWRVGMMRFAGMGAIIVPPPVTGKPKSYMIDPDQTVSFDPEDMFDRMEYEEKEDWRNV
jgi:hypothetical protein